MGRISYFNKIYPIDFLQQFWRALITFLCKPVDLREGASCFSLCFYFQKDLGSEIMYALQKKITQHPLNYIEIILASYIVFLIYAFKACYKVSYVNNSLLIGGKTEKCEAAFCKIHPH